MEQVVDQRDMGALRAHFFEVCGAHVHDHRLEPPTALGPEQREKHAKIFSTAPTPHPQHPLGWDLDDGRGVAMAALNRKLVDGDDPNRAQINRSQLAFQRAGVDLLDRVPPDPKPRGDLFDGKHLSEARDRGGQAGRYALIAIEPRDGFDGGATTRTLEARSRKDQPRFGLKNGQIAHAALADVMNVANDVSAATASFGGVRRRAQLQHDARDGIGVGRGLPLHAGQLKPFPPPKQRGDLVVGHQPPPMLKACDEPDPLSLYKPRNSRKNL